MPESEEMTAKNSQWDAVIQKVTEASGGVKRLYQPIDHPHFKDWEITQVCSDRLEAILNFTGDIKDKRALDIGCFFGYFSHRLAKLGARVVGVDIGPRKIGICKLLSVCYELPPTNPVFHHTRYEDHLKDGGFFDFILFLSQFHHDLREDKGSAWEEINLISEHTDLMFLDMNENVAKKIFPDWNPNFILDHTEFTKLTRLRPSHAHRRTLYAFEGASK